MSGLRLISETLPKATGRVFERKYILLGRVLERWEDIIGRKFYDRAQPVKIRYYKSKKSKSRSVSLDIATSSADATVLHYQKDLILERIQQIFGEGFITAIRFVPISDTKLQSNKISKSTKMKKLQPDDISKLSETLKNVEDEEIKNKLEKLGTSILQEPL